MARRTRTWTDVLVIFVGVTLLALAIWPGDPLASEELTADAAYPDLLWLLQALAGLLALSAMATIQSPRFRTLGRGLLVAAALALVAGLFLFRDFGWRAWLLFVLPAALLLLALPGFGPMPPPEQEPNPR